MYSGTNRRIVESIGTEQFLSGTCPILVPQFASGIHRTKWGTTQNNYNSPIIEWGIHITTHYAEKITTLWGERNRLGKLVPLCGLSCREQINSWYTRSSFLYRTFKFLWSMERRIDYRKFATFNVKNQNETSMICCSCETLTCKNWCER